MTTNKELAEIREIFPQVLDYLPESVQGMSPVSTDTLTARLQERRISQGVQETFSISPRGMGWTYTTPNGAIRWKSADPDAPNKYAWIGDERDSLLYLFDLKEAVEMAGGVIWLCTEFDYFAMRSAGIYHAVAQIQGESSVPADLPPLLQSIGVLACYIAPDRDETGERWAQKVANSLVPAGIDVIARTLPAKYKGYDLGDLWREYTGKLPFERYLLDLPSKKMQAEYPDLSASATSYEIPQDYRHAIANALGIRKFNGRGYSRSIRCIFHKDQNPSASLHNEFGLHCFTCGRWYTWKELGQALNLGRWEQEAPPVTVSAICLSDEALQELIKRGFTALARLLSSLYLAGYEAGQTFTAKDATELVPASTVYAAITQAEAIFLNLSVISSLLLNTRTKQKKIAGRKAKAHKMPSPAEVNTALNVTGTHYQPIDGALSAADFRAELYKRPIERKPGKYARKWICDPLGISTKTGSRYDKRAGLDVTPNYELKPITDSTELPDARERKPVYLLAGGKRFSATKAGYERAQKHGRVTKVTRLANTYRIGTV